MQLQGLMHAKWPDTFSPGLPSLFLQGCALCVDQEDPPADTSMLRLPDEMEVSGVQ
jgi:hypothetical protein